MRHLIALLMIVGSFLLTPVVSFAAEREVCNRTDGRPSGLICANITCSYCEVGPFMEGISRECGNLGTCSLDDIMNVVGNVGNYITGLIGAVVLLMYTIGGMYYVFSGGDSHKVDKGKSYLKISTVGLFIVFFAYVGVNTLSNVFRGGSVGSSPDTVVCNGQPNNTVCGDEASCQNGACTTICSQTPGRECINFTPDAADDYRGCVQSGCPEQGYCCDSLPNRSLPGDAPSNVSLP